MCVSVLKAANAKCVCVVTALSFVQVQPGQMRIDRPLMPSAANKWIIENPVVTPPRPVSEMRHSHLSTPMTQPEIDFVLVFVWVTERWIYSLTFIVSVTLFTYSFSYFITRWQWCCCFPWCQFCICIYCGPLQSRQGSMFCHLYSPTHLQIDWYVERDELGAATDDIFFAD